MMTLFILSAALQAVQPAAAQAADANTINLHRMLHDSRDVERPRSLRQPTAEGASAAVRALRTRTEGSATGAPNTTQALASAPSAGPGGEAPR